MMLICGQSNRVWHYWAGRYPGSVGVLLGPSYGTKVPIDPWMPFVLDNDAYTCWKNGLEWDSLAYTKFIQRVRMTGLKPLWAAVPDVVANREATLANWPKWAPMIKALGWSTAFCVQDGMTPADVPRGTDVVFVGGSDAFKFPTLPTWTKEFPRVHCARVNGPEMIQACEELGCESIDGTGWFLEPSRPDKVPALERFLERHHDKHHQLSLITR